MNTEFKQLLFEKEIFLQYHTN